MAADISLHTISLQLYHFLCQHIVGTEETVRTKRLMSTIYDNLCSDDIVTYITSGSVGEGLELNGSDIDVMTVWKTFVIHKDTDIVINDPEKIHLVMETSETKAGFTLLRTPYLSDEIDPIVQRGNSCYLSSELFKLDFQKITVDLLKTTIHGPCLTDENETLDFAHCLHYPHWIQPAENWIHRGQSSWPSSDVKSDIIDRGILLVPIGSKGSVNESLEWRISFSVAEKLLIYSFSHTQLLCYAMMKILLKDLINSNINCKHLLCSYFIKTIIFWVSEETPATEWKPENIIQCFMRCFKKLLYCLEYSMCPHYFIPIINMFENKIEEQPRQLLIGYLNTLFSFGWRCVLISEHFRNFTIYSNTLSSVSEIKRSQLGLLLSSHASSVPITTGKMALAYRRSIQILRNNKSSITKLVCMRFMSEICSNIYKSKVSSSEINAKIYSQRRTQLAYLLQNIHHDAVSGWIMLATFFYKAKQYRNALYILSYAMMKCTPEKVYLGIHLSQLQLRMTTSTTLHRIGIMRALKLVQVRNLQWSPLLPEELALYTLQGCSFPPVVFAHFLCFLCHYHLNDIQQCYNSIRNIQLTIDERYFILETSLGYILLGVALQLMRQTNLAVRAFTNVLHCKTLTCIKTTAAELLLMMYMGKKID